MPVSGGGSRVGLSAFARRRNSVTVTIERLGHQGDGIADGPVYVSRTLPGEVIDGDVYEGRIVSPRIVTPSPNRVAPPCAHYKGCGGCALQHASVAFVAEWKIDVVRRALEARGVPAPIRQLHTSPPQSRRRATFSGRRTMKGATIGFHGTASDQIREVPNCLLVRPALREVLPKLEPLVAQGASRKGEIKLTLTETETGLDLAVNGGKELTLELRQSLIGISHAAGIVRLSWDGDVVAAERAPVLTFGSAPVTPPPGAFLQATREGEAALLALVREALDSADGPIIDLFSGVGTFALPLAAERDVHAVESVGEMLAALDHGWRHGTGLHKVTTEPRDLFRRPMLSDELARFSGAVIDPPRAGAETQTIELAKAGPNHIAFVSCNPVTFARDAEVLTVAGYELRWLDVVDQFRWSPHIELAAQFVRA